MKNYQTKGVNKSMMNRIWVAQSAPPRTRLQKIGLLLPVLLLLQALALGLNPSGTVKAEGFSDPAFQQQWKLTDEAVATGKASRTYFWGPQPFAHTAEVYEGSPFNGQRRVQYFDKARMELPRKEGQPDDLVTNGLLTVELVTGQLQVGDTQFLQRSPATNPVAGDQVGNSLTPSYASFNQGNLAFGVSGATKATDRTGQPVNEAVNANGQVSTLSQTPISLKYARYFNETGHNVAEVFNNFFQADPLGESKWLSVMGYPITEPFWAKDKVVVGGQPRDVLIQLFQRRALTYTPSNSAAFQVEMGNIGQHYYVWRYGFETRDQLPGNYRLINPVGKTLYSTSIRKPSDKVILGDAPSTITGLWALNEGRAIVAVDKKTYLADLTKARAFKELTPPTGDGLNPANIAVFQAVGSPDSKKIAITFGSGSTQVVQVYEVNTLSGDNIAVTDNYRAFTLSSNNTKNIAFSDDSRYLMAAINDGLAIFDVIGRQNKVLDVKGPAYWVGKSNQLLVTSPPVVQYDEAVSAYKVITNGKISLVDAVTNTIKQLVEGPKIKEALPSPDGNYFALRQSVNLFDSSGSSSLIKNLLTFRSIADPTNDLTPTFEQGTGGRSSSEPSLVGWSADGTYLQIQSRAGFTAGSNRTDNSFVSLVNGKPLKQQEVPGNYLSVVSLRLAAPVYTIKALHTYNGPYEPSDQSITLQNFDNSEQTVLFSVKVTQNQTNNDTPIRLARVVQVPVV